MKCFTHTDLDGHCAGAIVYSAKHHDCFADDFYYVNYTDPIPLDEVKNGETVIFTDYSFTEATYCVLDELVNTKKCRVVWIDHHNSSLELIKAHPWLNDIEGIRSSEHSGAYLAWQYFFPDLSIPKAVELVSDYDCWKFKLDGTMAFKLGVEACKDWSATSFVWHELLNNNDKVVKYIDNGNVILDYVNSKNKEYCDNYSYVTEIEGLECLAINYKTNSSVFGDRYGEYPLHLVWVFDGEGYSCSIYSNDKNVDCSKIAERYGGGGHKGAAGFYLKTMPFKKVSKV